MREKGVVRERRGLRSTARARTRIMMQVSNKKILYTNPYRFAPNPHPPAPPRVSVRGAEVEAGRRGAAAEVEAARGACWPSALNARAPGRLPGRAPT